MPLCLELILLLLQFLSKRMILLLHMTFSHMPNLNFYYCNLQINILHHIFVRLLHLSYRPYCVICHHLITQFFLSMLILFLSHSFSQRHYDCRSDVLTLSDSDLKYMLVLSSAFLPGILSYAYYISYLQTTAIFYSEALNQDL